MTSANPAPDELRLLRELVVSQQREIAQLREKIDLLLRRFFSSSSEKIDPAQLELLLQLQPATAQVAQPEPVVPVQPPVRPREKRAPRLPENLPVVEVVVEPAEVLAQPGAWRRIGQEVSEQLDYEPGRFLRRRIVRPTYVHVSEPDQAPVTAPLCEKLLDRGIAAPGLLAQVLVSKYVDHLPLYRQEQIFAQRHKVNLSRATLSRWVELCADWLLPIYEQIRTGVLGGGYVQMDETPVAYLAPGHGQTKQGYLWVACRPGAGVFFQWEISRAAECVEKLVPATFQGVIQCDGYSAYRAFATGRKDLELAGCWAHVRRRFREAMAQSPRGAAWFLKEIQHLYQIESSLREEKAGPDQRLSVRQEQSRRIVERIRKVLVAYRIKRRHVPKSAMGEAIDYALGQWDGLEVFLQDGRVEIDNNLVENGIRPTAVGKKNWLFMGEAGAGQRGAIIYTIVENCRFHRIDPYSYLKDVLSRLPAMKMSQVPEITPLHWAKAHAASPTPATS
jgi:transposase